MLFAELVHFCNAVTSFAGQIIEQLVPCTIELTCGITELLLVAVTQTVGMGPKGRQRVARA